MSKDYSERLNIPYESCHAVILELQLNALEKLKQRGRFKESGIATVKIKMLCEGQSPKIITKELSLTSLTGDFKNSIAKDIQVPIERFVTHSFIP